MKALIARVRNLYYFMDLCLQSIMTTCIIFHSHSGITRGTTEQFRNACGGDYLIKVKFLKKYNKLTVYATPQSGPTRASYPEPYLTKKILFARLFIPDPPT
jgi:hypothetical protein